MVVAKRIITINLNCDHNYCNDYSLILVTKVKKNIFTLPSHKHNIASMLCCICAKVQIFAIK